MARLFELNRIKFLGSMSGILASTYCLAQSELTEKTGSIEPAAEEHENYAYIIIGGLLLVIVAVVLYRKQYRKFNE